LGAGAAGFDSPESESGFDDDEGVSEEGAFVEVEGEAARFSPPAFL
jgi:hypothetical protein